MGLKEDIDDMPRHWQRINLTFKKLHTSANPVIPLRFTLEADDSAGRFKNRSGKSQGMERPASHAMVVFIILAVGGREVETLGSLLHMYVSHKVWFPRGEGVDLFTSSIYFKERERFKMPYRKSSSVPSIDCVVKPLSAGDAQAWP
jgi:hypothetical protein